VRRQQVRGRPPTEERICLLRCFNVYLSYSNPICWLILACHCVIAGGHLVASFKTAPLPTVAT
jgi:hypothetical protein